MSDSIPRKWALRTPLGGFNVFTRGANESARHVIMKAVIWALYLPQYPTMSVEQRIGDRYKPDLVAYAQGPQATPYEVVEKPLFWGESGVVSVDKINSIGRRYPDTHFVIAKWGGSLKPHLRVMERALDGVPRAAPFDLLRVPEDAQRRFVSAASVIQVQHSDLDWQRLLP